MDTCMLRFVSTAHRHMTHSSYMGVTIGNHRLNSLFYFHYTCIYNYLADIRFVSQAICITFLIAL